MKKLFVLVACAAPALAFASATAPMGVPLQVRHGFYAEADTGGFFTIGGLHGVSNAQLFVGAGVGYDVIDRLSLAVHFDVGSSSGNCFTPSEDPATGECIDPQYVKTDQQGNSSQIALASNFAVFGMNLQARYAVDLAERFTLAPKLLVGAGTLTPLAVAPPNKTPTDSDGFHALVGAGVGLQYATNLDHFTVGFDVEFRMIVGPNVPALAFYPRLKYTF